MTRVLVTMPFSEAQLDRIRAALSAPHRDARRPGPGRLPGSRGPVHGEPAPATSARAPDLRWVQLHMAGVNSLQDHPLYRDTAISRSPRRAASTPPRSPSTRSRCSSRSRTASRGWSSGTRRKAWPPDAERWRLFVPTEVRGATLGVIGYGSIGRELARIATSAFGMTVLACKRDPATRADRGYGLPGTGDPDGALPADWYGPAELPRMLPRCDVVVLCAPLTAETRHLIDRAAISAMKPTAYFINVGRGASVDEAALARRAGGAPDRRRGHRRVRHGAAGGGASLLRPRQRHPVAARVGVPAELRRPVRRAVRREPAPLPGRRAAPEPGRPGAGLLTAAASAPSPRAGVREGKVGHAIPRRLPDPAPALHGPADPRGLPGGGLTPRRHALGLGPHVSPLRTGRRQPLRLHAAPGRDRGRDAARAVRLARAREQLPEPGAPGLRRRHHGPPERRPRHPRHRRRLVRARLPGVRVRVRDRARPACGISARRCRGSSRVSRSWCRRRSAACRS